MINQIKPILSEIGKQFEDIFQSWYDPEEREKRKILERREQKKKQSKEDVGV